MIQGSWRKQHLEISRKTVMSIMNFQSTWAAIIDNEDSKTHEKISVPGRKLQTVSFEIRPSRAAGKNPEAVINAWASLVGLSAPLLIAGRRFGPKYLMLQEVNAGEMILDNYGRIIEASLQLSFIEDRGGRRAKAKALYGKQVQSLSPAMVKRLTAAAADKSSRK